MKTDFEIFLEKLSEDLNLILKANSFNECKLKIDGQLDLSIKYNKTKSHILFGCPLVELPAGKFKENVFLETLKYNNQIPSTSFFGYKEKTSHLILFQYIFLDLQNYEMIYEDLAQFVETAFLWKNAIERGDAAPIEFSREMNTKKSLF